ncbi:MAG: ROK family protein [Verrucomicrobia bacterium]|nr:ROK family protein [Verrucomicrobiota bacterium]
MDGALGIDLGGSSVKSVAVTLTGQIRLKSNIPFNPDQNMDWGKTILESIRALREDSGITPSAIGLSAPGLASADGRHIACMPGRLQGLERLDWSDYLKVDHPVWVLNDGHAALCGEAWLGAARGFSNVVQLTLGTGVGGAAMVDGKLLRGAVGRAGHFGHMSLDPEGPPDVCLSPGSLEVAIGNCTILERSNGRFESTHDLIKAHLTGDSTATAIWMKSVKALACGLCSIINVLDPEAAIIGGGIARAGDALFTPLKNFLNEIEWRPLGEATQILPAQLGEYAGAVGAARNALDKRGA